MKEIEAIAEKLNFMNINKIISIDNEWKINSKIDSNKDLIELIEETYPQNKDELLRIISNESLKTIEDGCKSQIKEIIEFIEQIEKEKNKLPPDLEKLDKILNLLSEHGFEIKRYSDYKEEIFKENNENCLFILDKDMNTRGKSDIIKYSIPKILEEGENKNKLIIIYSSNIQEEYTTNENKLKYINKEIGKTIEDKLYVYKMFAIKKGSTEPLEERINNTLSECIYGDALYKYMQFEKQKNEKTYDEICKIENSQISNIVKDNIIEGANIIDTLEQLSNTIKKIEDNNQKQINQNIIQQFNFYEKGKIKNFLKENAELKKSCNYKNYREQVDKEIVKRLANHEISVWENIDYSVNSLYKDISTGDIFKISQEKEMYALVIENACNCIVRNQNNLTDIRRRIDEIQVLIFEEIKDIEENELIRNIQEGKIIYPIKCDKKIKILKSTGEIKQISPYILDLCTLNEEGRCIIDYSKEEIEKYKSYYIEEYLKRINSEKEQTSKIFNIRELKNTIKQSRIKHITPKELALKRIGRLNYNYTLYIMQNIYFEKENQIIEENTLDEYKNKEAQNLKKMRKSIKMSTNKNIAIGNKKTG